MRERALKNRINDHRNRPALLLCLLPLLFFSSFGEALHSHPLFLVSSRVTMRANAAGCKYLQPVASFQRTPPECLACRWAAQSLSLSALNVFTAPQGPLSVALRTRRYVAFATRVKRDARGPPFELSFRAVPIRLNNSKEIKNEKSKKDGVHLD
jgi:hypothetical protein